MDDAITLEVYLVCDKATQMLPLKFQPMKGLPSVLHPKCSTTSFISCTLKLGVPFNSKPNQTSANVSASSESRNYFGSKPSLLLQMGLLLTVVEPAIAVTGVNDELDLVKVLIEVGVVAFGYFLIMPPIIMNWLRIRWYRRNLLEMYIQFMFVFIFFPGVLLWAPFLNFRKFPRDPSMKYPWSKPENPSEIRGGFLKYPWGSIEDYE
ncbi:hypothetical protein RND81_11G233200 [Saponaria officinalis]|uniref:Uncharacterized protein n=1 Tax=Saponaria officinalis TaxID=3572 RepID=A0AAW1HPX5_SAPOF